ncbi:hypothetical protein [Arthrobacter sp. 260]|uniref:hypothetical protein n=1 Tax=Arthrobacter sp. 260 TaxID=2735314 RepID=UPI00149171F4|nr:hypothetical protein [Arthrobacter sp. 260]NOJ60960.1 hypothetical protein [Arthrobacter sp. 260]
MEEECAWWDGPCKLREGVGDFVGGAVGGAIEDLAAAISDAMAQIVLTLATFWVDMPTSNLTMADGSASPTVAFLQSGLWYWTAALAVLGVIVGGTRIVWEQRGSHVRELVRSLLTLTLVSGMGLAVIAFLIIASDGFSSWIIDQATDGDGFANAIQGMLITGQADTAIFMVIILGLIGIVTSIVQIVLMVVRSGMLVVLAGILPTTAAFTNTEMGKQWFQKTIAWTLAFILYKPAAAIVYAVAFRLVSGGEMSGFTGILNSITGLALMVVALFALPALLRFVTPMVGAVASGGGGGMAAGAGAAAMAAMPSGARSLGAAGRGSGSASPTPASSSSGGGSGSGGGGGGSKSSPSGSSTSGNSSGGAAPTPGATGGGKAGSATGGVPALAAAASSGANKAAGGGGGAPASSGGSSGSPAGGPSGGGAAASGGGAAVGGGASGAAAGARVGAAAGPAGAAAGAAVAPASKGVQAVKQVSEEAAGDGPSGSNSQ